jgi:hypothetical protein
VFVILGFAGETIVEKLSRLACGCPRTPRSEKILLLDPPVEGEVTEFGGIRLLPLVI